MIKGADKNSRIYTSLTYGVINFLVDALNMGPYRKTAGVPLRWGVLYIEIFKSSARPLNRQNHPLHRLGSRYGNFP